MKSVVLGKVIENVYSVDTKQKTITDEHGEEKKVYTAKPVLKKEPKVKEWKEICSFDGEPRYNCEHDSWSIKWTIAAYDGQSHCLNVSKDEKVAVKEEIFRADLNELHLHTDKVLEEIDVNKEGANYEYEAHVEQFNKMMITSNKMMQDYCDLHGLDYRKADCTKVFSLVYPDKKYEIKDGKMICKPEPMLTVLEAGNYAIGSIVDTACCVSAKIDALETSVSNIATACY